MREYDCERCAQEVCECPHWGFWLRVAIVLVGLVVTGCTLGAIVWRGPE